MPENESSEEDYQNQDGEDQQPNVPKYSDESQPPNQEEPGDKVTNSDDIDPDEKEKIEEEIKNIAKEYEQQNVDQPKSPVQELMITLLFIFGPILYFILSIGDGLFSSFRSIVINFSLSVSAILFILVIWESIKKARR